MRRFLTRIGVLALLAVSTLGQNSEKTTVPIAEIHEVNPNGLVGSQAGIIGSISGPYVGGGLYRVRSASMLELIAAAYGVSGDKIAGGPAWLTFNRYDVTAKLPAGATTDTIKTMLQTLLADRFRLAAHNGESPLTVWGIKATARPLLKPSAGTGESGCQRQQGPASAQRPPGVDLYICRNITMQAFAEAIPKMVADNALNGYSISDQTNLKGAWDFDITFRAAVGTPTGQEPLSFFDAMPKQLGLDLSLTKAALPAVVVDSVNPQPTANPALVADLLPKLPASFDVAEIKPIAPDAPNRGYNNSVQPGGRVLFNNIPLAPLIQRAWEFPNRESFVGPKFLETERVDIVAQVPALDGSDAAGTSAAARQADLVNAMLQRLITERYKLEAHQEERPLTAYTLHAVKSKLQKADPSNRTGCLRVTGSLTAASPAASRVNGNTFECQNMTIAQFVKFLQYCPYSNLTRASVSDATGLNGAWDFTLSFTPVVAPTAQTTNAATGDAPVAATPDGRVTLFEALESQLGLKLETTKRPGPVFVIDRMERNHCNDWTQQMALRPELETGPLPICT